MLAYLGRFEYFTAYKAREYRDLIISSGSETFCKINCAVTGAFIVMSPLSLNVIISLIAGSDLNKASVVKLTSKSLSISDVDKRRFITLVNRISNTAVWY